MEFSKFTVANINSDADNKVSPHFRVQEFACKDGSPIVFINSRLVDVLENIRDLAGEPLYINSGYRTVSHNTAVHGAANSQHLWGMAADIHAKKTTSEQLYQMAEQTMQALGIGGGIIWYPNFIHVDVRAVAYRQPKD